MMSDFSMQMERAKEALLQAGIISNVSASMAIQDFRTRHGFTDETVEKERGMFHEICHIIPDAVSGAPADEGLTLIAERIFLRGNYDWMNLEDDPIHGEPLDPIDAYNDIRISIEIRIKEGLYYLDRMVLDRKDDILSGFFDENDFNPDVRKRFEDDPSNPVPHMDRIANVDRWPHQLFLSEYPEFQEALHARFANDETLIKYARLKEEHVYPDRDELEEVYESLIEKERFFRAFTGGRSLYQLSTQEMLEMPITCFGIFPVKEGENYRYDSLPDFKRKEILENLRSPDASPIAELVT